VRLIIPPEFCPSCGSALKWQNDLLYCRNTSCGEQLGKKIEHFAKSLKIKGLGPATLSKLELNSIADLYFLEEMDLSKYIGSDRMAEKLCKEIQNSEKVTLNRLLPAFAIPLVGNSVSEKLATVCHNISDIDDDTCRQAGLGPKTTSNLLDWIEDNAALIDELPFSFNFEKPRLTGNMGVVCISGRLKSYKTKAEATDVLQKLGYTVKSSVTKDVTILINESGIESAKTKRARDAGITIVTNLKDFIGE